jgi:hypothetical protein
MEKGEAKREAMSSMIGVSEFKVTVVGGEARERRGSQGEAGSRRRRGGAPRPTRCLLERQSVGRRRRGGGVDLGLGHRGRGGIAAWPASYKHGHTGGELGGWAGVGLPPNSRVGSCPPVGLGAGLGKHNALSARSGSGSG